MNDKNFIVVCALVSISFVLILDNAFTISTEPAKHIIEFHINGKTVLKPFNCDPQSFTNQTTLICTDGEVIRP